MQILEYSYLNFNQYQKTHIQAISYISSMTNLYISSIPKNLYMAWWTISYISSIPTWIRCLPVSADLGFWHLTTNVCAYCWLRWGWFGSCGVHSVWSMCPCKCHAVERQYLLSLNFWKSRTGITKTNIIHCTETIFTYINCVEFSEQ